LFVTTNTSHSANPFLFKKLPYDPIQDFAPVAGIMNIPVIVVVDPKLPINSLQDLVAYAKARPGQVSFGYGNSIGQVVGASFAKAAGIEVVSVPYKSSPQAMTDVMGGQVVYGITDMAAGQAIVKAGKLRALGVSSEKRSSLMPDLPAISETPGLAGFELTAWVAMFAPAGTPKSDCRPVKCRGQKVVGQTGDEGAHHAVRRGSDTQHPRSNWPTRSSSPTGVDVSRTPASSLNDPKQSMNLGAVGCESTPSAFPTISTRTTMAGLYYDQFEVGKTIKHAVTRTVTEMDNTLFSVMTMNNQPLHIDAQFAAESEFGQRLVNSIFTLGLIIGISVNDTTLGTTIANLGMTDVRFPKPVFHGDTLSAETEIIAKRMSKSRADAGIVEFEHRGRNQRGESVCVCRRSAFMKCRPAT